MSDCITLSKHCNHCDTTYPATSDFWHKDKKGKFGFAIMCKECAKAKSKRWVTDNSERNKENCKRYYRNNPDKIQEYKEKNAIEIAAKKRQYRKDNPEKTKRHKTESAKRNRPHLNEYNRKWNKLHPEVGRISVERRLARKKALPDIFKRADWLHCLDWWSHQCAYCGKMLDGKKRTHMDHFIPLTAIGCPGTVPTNIIPACVSCNASKNNSDPYIWVKSRFPDTFGGILYRIESYFASLDTTTE